MAQITKEITVDVAKKNLFQAIMAKQYDEDSRFLRVTLVNEGVPIDVDASSSVSIEAERADGATNSFPGKVNSDGTVTVPIDSWMLQLDDMVRCDISVKESESRKLTSASFYIEVERAANYDNDIPAGDFEIKRWEALEERIAELEKGGGSGGSGGNGSPGKDGASAYEVAVANGFDGDEAAWLASLKGPQGQTGETGLQGPAGKDGKSAYTYAQDGGYTGTEEWFGKQLAFGISFVTPQMFGARGDGVTDDTTSINNALASGKDVFFPDGTYKITSPLILPTGTHLSGVCGLSIIKSYITDGYVIIGAGGSTTVASANIENLTFQNGNSQDSTTKLISGNFVDKAEGLYMRNCRIKAYYDVFNTIENNSYLVNNRFTGIYHAFIGTTLDSIIDGNYINASRYGVSYGSKVFSSFNSTSFTNNLVDYFYDCFALSASESGTIVGNTFNRVVNVFHDHIAHLTIANNIFTQIMYNASDWSVLTADQIATLSTEKWCIIKFDNASFNTTNHIMAVNSFTNNVGYKCEYYIYIADGVQVVPADCEFRGNQISTGSGNKLSAVDAGFRNAAATESSYNSMKNCYFDFWDMKEYDALPSATLYGNTAKSVVSFPYMKAVYGGEIYTNHGGTWVKDNGYLTLDTLPVYDGGVA